MESKDNILPQVWQKRIVLALFIALVLVVVAKIFSVLVPFILAWIAAYLVSPAVDWLEKRTRMKRDAAVILVMVLFALVILALISITIPIIINEASIFAEYFPRYRDRAVLKIEELKSSGRIPPEFELLLMDALSKLQESAPQIAATVGTWIYSWLGSLLGIFGFMMDLLIFGFIFYYFLADFHLINQKMIRAVPAKHRESLKGLLDDIDVNLRAVLRGQFVVAVVLAIIYSIGFQLAGVPYSILIGLVTGFGNFLPYVGPVLGLIPAFGFVALHSLGDQTWMLYQFAGILAVFGIAQFLEGFVLTPKLAGKSAGLGPVTVLFALSVGGVLFGLIGVVIALPCAAIVKVLLERLWAFYTATDFYQA